LNRAARDRLLAGGMQGETGMAWARRLGRICLSIIFIAGSWDAARAPGGRPAKVAALGLPQPELLVRADGAAMVAAGGALALDRWPRLAAALLAALLAPASGSNSSKTLGFSAAYCSSPPTATSRPPPEIPAAGRNFAKSEPPQSNPGRSEPGAVAGSALAPADAACDHKHGKRKRHCRQRHHRHNGGDNGNGNGHGNGVGKGGTDDCTVCASGCPFTSVQAAIVAATAGGTVTVCPGTYKENLTIGINLTLVGSGNVTLDGNQNGPVFGNEAKQTAGGIFKTNEGVVTLDDQSAVIDNTPNNCVGTDACGA
jgi:uncharacterized membrane protein YphA (DoxX/SURF4 family)